MSAAHPRVQSVTDEQPTRLELSEACAELVKLWHTRGEINPDRQLNGYHDARLHSVSGLAAHTYRAGEVGARLLRDALWLECSPIVRTSYECAITAQWAAQVPDGIQALLNEDYRSRRSMAETLRGSQAWAEPGLLVPTPDDHDHQSLSNAQARNFKQMCEDLSPGGAEAYSYYKTLCWFSHATNYVADYYTDLLGLEDNSLRMKLRRAPRADNENAYLVQFFCAVSLVWAASALDQLDADKSHRRQIAKIAERIGVQPAMKLTAKAKGRGYAGLPDN